MIHLYFHFCLICNLILFAFFYLFYFKYKLKCEKNKNIYTLGKYKKNELLF